MINGNHGVSRNRMIPNVRITREAMLKAAWVQRAVVKNACPQNSERGEQLRYYRNSHNGKIGYGGLKLR